MVLWLPYKNWRYLGNNHFRLLSNSHSCRSRCSPICSDSPPAERNERSLRRRKHESINAFIEFDCMLKFNSIHWTIQSRVSQTSTHTPHHLPELFVQLCAYIFVNEKPIRSDRLLFFCSDEPSELYRPLLHTSFKWFECSQRECTPFLFTFTQSISIAIRKQRDYTI